MKDQARSQEGHGGREGRGVRKGGEENKGERNKRDREREMKGKSRGGTS